MQALTKRGTLPASYPKGAKKAYKEMQKFYGPEEGRRIFVEKALDHGTGEGVRAVVASVYAKGTRL